MDIIFLFALYLLISIIYHFSLKSSARNDGKSLRATDAEVPWFRLLWRFVAFERRAENLYWISVRLPIFWTTSKKVVVLSYTGIPPSLRQCWFNYQFLILIRSSKKTFSLGFCSMGTFSALFVWILKKKPKKHFLGETLYI